MSSVELNINHTILKDFVKVYFVLEGEGDINFNVKLKMRKEFVFNKEILN